MTAGAATSRRWGKAGVRLVDREIRSAALQAGRKRHEAEQQRERDRQAWAAGHVRPYRITTALDSHSLYGPGVDGACGVAEPAVDQWEAGTLYPTWGQLCALADLCGVTPGFFMARGTDERAPLLVAEASLRFHVPDAAGIDGERPFVPVFTPEAIAATVGGGHARPAPDALAPVADVPPGRVALRINPDTTAPCNLCRSGRRGTLTVHHDGQPRAGACRWCADQAAPGLFAAVGELERAQAGDVLARVRELAPALLVALGAPAEVVAALAAGPGPVCSQPVDTLPLSEFTRNPSERTRT